MKKKTITICGKEVTLAYCYGTEIGYKILSDEDINDFGIEIAEKINKKQMPDIRKTLYLIIAAMNAYCEYKEEDAPITDKDLMSVATPQEIGQALGTIIGLRAEFYHVPSDEPKDKEESNEKNV